MRRNEGSPSSECAPGSIAEVGRWCNAASLRRIADLFCSHCQVDYRDHEWHLTFGELDVKSVNKKLDGKRGTLTDADISSQRVSRRIRGRKEWSMKSGSACWG